MRRFASALLAALSIAAGGWRPASAATALESLSSLPYGRQLAAATTTLEKLARAVRKPQGALGRLGQALALQADALPPAAPALTGGGPLTTLAATLGLSEPLFDLAAAVEAAGRAARDAVGDPQALAAGQLPAAVDSPALAQAALGVAGAVDELLASPRQLATAPVVDVCGLLAVGSPGPDTYTCPHLLVVDPGGNDTYVAQAAVTPASTLPLPVSVVVDLGGNDTYASDPAAPWCEPGGGAPWLRQCLFATAGTGVGGIGLVFDAGGDDSYAAATANTPPGDCRSRAAVGEGFGAAGLGGVVDLDGSDTYTLTSYDTFPSSCHARESMAFGQGAGVDLGTGVLVDAGGDDHYTVDALNRAKDGNVFYLVAQGASSGGVGVLIDVRGRDVYLVRGQADDTLNPPSFRKDALGLIVAQGAVSGVTEAHSPSSLPAALQGGTPAGTIKVCEVFAEGLSTGTCLPGVGVALDAGGSDEWTILSTASNSVSCTDHTASVVVGQGGAGNGGLAALVTADQEGTDFFSMTANGRASGCSYPAGAAVHGQGYGGWLASWANTCFTPSFVCRPTVLAPGTLNATAFPLWTPAVGLSLRLGGPNAPATYTAVASASNTTSRGARALTFVQGAGSDLKGNALDWWQGTPPFGPTRVSAGPASVALRSGLGLGAHIDLSPAPTIRRVASAATAPAGALAAARTEAQGVGTEGLGALLDAGGNDLYSAAASGAAGQALTLAQGRASGKLLDPTCVSPQPGCTSSPLPAAALFADLGGTDTYAASPPPSPNCPGNGRTWTAANPLPPSSCNTGDAGWVIGLDV